MKTMMMTNMLTDNLITNTNRAKNFAQKNKPQKKTKFKFLEKLSGKFSILTVVWQPVPSYRTRPSSN